MGASLKFERLLEGGTGAPRGGGGGANGAVELLQQMAARGLTPDARTYAAAITACAAGGEWPEALGFLEVRGEGERERASVTIAWGPDRSARLTGGGGKIASVAMTREPF